MKDKLHKVKRPYVNWYETLKNLQDPYIEAEFLALKSKHRLMSNNRCAYNVLRRYYSTTTLNSYRWCGTALRPITHQGLMPCSSSPVRFADKFTEPTFTPLLDPLSDDWYEPNDYPEGDIGSATVSEMRIQNGDY